MMTLVSVSDYVKLCCPAYQELLYFCNVQIFVTTCVLNHYMDVTKNATMYLYKGLTRNPEIIMKFEWSEKTSLSLAHNEAPTIPACLCITLTVCQLGIV